MMLGMSQAPSSNQGAECKYLPTSIRVLDRLAHVNHPNRPVFSVDLHLTLPPVNPEVPKQP